MAPPLITSKNPQVNISKLNSAMYKIIYLNQVGFIPLIQAWLILKKPNNVIYHVTALKEEKTWSSSQDIGRKAFGKI